MSTRPQRVFQKAFRFTAYATGHFGDVDPSSPYEPLVRLRAWETVLRTNGLDATEPPHVAELPIERIESLEGGRVLMSEGIGLDGRCQLREVPAPGALLVAHFDRDGLISHFVRLTYSGVELLPFNLNASSDSNATVRLILHGVRYLFD